MQRSFQSTLTCPHVGSNDFLALPITRALTKKDMSSLCERDVANTMAKFEKLEVGSNETHIAVVPTEEIISWLHGRAAFTCAKIYGQAPQSHGRLCESADVWLYWFHDFRKRQLAVQRVGGNIEKSGLQKRAAAKLLLDALEEASRFNLPKVVVWDPSHGLESAMDILEQGFSVEVKTEERIGRSIPSVRWKCSNEPEDTVLQLNEFYAWS